MWLRHWEGDAGSASRLVGVPFKGEKLFGETLEPLLMENKDKQKVLVSNKKEPPKKNQFFCPLGSRA